MQHHFLDIANTIIDKGLNIIEVTLTTPNAIDIIAELSKRDDALIGAG
ncbi:2-dehydro-3-deoxyphosphogluconate aldolase, partial [Staphylococcus saprophyticus]|nr:2-dehydro-3-deoxyphosphogluconate aldolase [Staphylococcus saprophyticus]